MVGADAFLAEAFSGPLVLMSCLRSFMGWVTLSNLPVLLMSVCPEPLGVFEAVAARRLALKAAEVLFALRTVLVLKFFLPPRADLPFLPAFTLAISGEDESALGRDKVVNKSGLR